MGVTSLLGMLCMEELNKMIETQADRQTERDKGSFIMIAMIVCQVHCMSVMKFVRLMESVCMARLLKSCRRCW